MRITNLAIKNRVATVVLTVLLEPRRDPRLRVDSEGVRPQIEFATIVVTTVYPGASPDDIESIITQEVEREVAGISGIDETALVLHRGRLQRHHRLHAGRERGRRQDRREGRRGPRQGRVSERRRGAHRVELDTSEFPIISINLAASYSLAQLRDVAEDLEGDIEGVPGVLEVDLIGGLEREVQVNVDLNALQGYNLTFNDVIRRSSRRTPTSRVVPSTSTG